jgi:nitrogen-specific signal transduction histidine kinase/GAF domain-containing protein
MVCKRVPCDYGVILTVDKQENKLALDVLHGYPSGVARKYRSERLKLPIERGTSVSAEALVTAQAGEAKAIIVSGASDVQFRIASGVKQVLGYAVNSLGDYVAVMTLESLKDNVFDRFKIDEDAQKELKEYANLIAVAFIARQSLVYKFDEFIEEKNFSDPDDLNKDIINWVYNKFNVNTCNLYFIEYDESTGADYLIPKYSIIDAKLQGNVPDLRYRSGEGYCGWVAAHNASMILTDFENDQSPALDEYAKKYGSRPERTGRFKNKYPSLMFKSYLGVPVVSGKRVVGVLEVLDRKREYAFTDEGLLEIIAHRIGTEYTRIIREKRRENLFDIPNIETRNLPMVIRGVVDAAVNFTSATHGFFMSMEDGSYFRAQAVRGHNLKESDIRDVRMDDKTLVSLVIEKHAHFICQDIEEDRKGLDEEQRAYLDNTRFPKGFIPQSIKSLLIVPVYMKDSPEAPSDKAPDPTMFEDLGVLVLMSYKPGAFQQEAVVITALAEIVCYHIWGNKKLAELQAKTEKIYQLEQALPKYSLAAQAASASAGTVHTAAKHISDVTDAIVGLMQHKKVREDRDLLGLAERIAKPFDDLTRLYERLHDVFSGVEPKFETFDLAELVQEVRDYMEPTFRKRHIDFSSHVKDASLPKVKADSMLMKVVFINLLRNSIDANARKITIHARETTTSGTGGLPKKEAVELTFKDDGIGIPPSEQPNVFKPFITANKKGGTGLGLAVNKEILGKHQGEIDIISSVVGEGTTISVKLPLDLSENR